jgi:hypothetical protein
MYLRYVVICCTVNALRARIETSNICRTGKVAPLDKLSGEAFFPRGGVEITGPLSAPHDALP